MHSTHRIDQYTFRRKVIALVPQVLVYNKNGLRTLYCRQMMFRSDVAINVYADDRSTQKLFDIQARPGTGLSRFYDVTDRLENRRIGVLQRKSSNLIIVGEMRLIDEQGRIFAVLSKHHDTLSRRRGYLRGSWLPNRFSIIDPAERTEIAAFYQGFSLLGYYLTLNILPNLDLPLDPRLGISAGLLLGMAEVR